MINAQYNEKTDTYNIEWSDEYNKELALFFLLIGTRLGGLPEKVLAVAKAITEAGCRRNDSMDNKGSIQ